MVLRYPGGKTRACKILDSIIQDHYDISEFKILISPFFGGGSFEFFINKKYKLKVIGNDKFKPLYTFWDITKNENDKLRSKLQNRLNKVSKERFQKYRDKIMDEENELYQAYMYFIINRCSFSGATLSGGFSLESSQKRFTQSCIDRVRDLNLDDFKFYNLDFSDFLDHESIYNSRKKMLIFLDPPYYLEKASKLYGKNGDMHENFDHVGLFDSIKNKKNWIMTYNNCDYIRDLYKDFTILDASWSYGMNKSKESSEIVIIN